MRGKFMLRLKLLLVWLAPLFFGAGRWTQAQDASFVELRPVKSLVSAQKLRLLTSYAEFRGGTLAIADYARIPPQQRKNGAREWHAYLHLVCVGKNAAATSSTSFRVGNGGWVYDPQFSPDGKTLLFKLGNTGYSHSNFSLVFWDMKSKRAQIGPEDVVFRRMLWSPDSRYLAYALGGDIEGNASVKWPLELFIYDTQTRKSRLVARNIGVKWMEWAAPHTLFFTQMSGELDEPSTHAAVYSVEAQGAVAPRLILPNAIEPHPSPDGKSFLFFGWLLTRPDPTQPSLNRTQSLYRFDIGSKPLVALLSDLTSEDLAGMRWLPNGKVVWLRKTRVSPRAQVAVEIFDPRSGSRRQVATLDSRDIEPYFPTDAEPKFSIVALSAKGDTLFVQVQEVIGVDPPFLVITSTLRAINLRTGKIVGGIKYGTVHGLDWTEQSAKK